MKICGLILSLAVLISLIEFRITATSNPKYLYDVLLGGETDSPLKNTARQNLKDLNLQITELSNDGMSIHRRNEIIGNSSVLLYVLDKESRNSLTMNEIAYLLGRHCGSLIVVFTTYEYKQKIKNENLSNGEYYDLNYGMDVLQYLTLRHHVKKYDDLAKAMDYIKTKFHKDETRHDDDDDDDNLLDEQCMSDLQGNAEESKDEMIEETTTETIEVTTEEQSENFDSPPPVRRRRSDENVEANVNDKDSQATSNDDDNNDDDNDDDDYDDDDYDYSSDQCEIETGFDFDDTDGPQSNPIIDQPNKNHDLDELFNSAFENQASDFSSDPSKLSPKYAWEVLQNAEVCPKFLNNTQTRLFNSRTSIDKLAFKTIANDCISFQKESGSTCKAWGKGNPGLTSSLYYGAFNVNSTIQENDCKKLKQREDAKFITCYYPNLNYYDISQIGVEMNHLNISRSRLISIPSNNYATALTVMASYLIGVKAENLVLDLKRVTKNKTDHLNRFTNISEVDYNRGRTYLTWLAAAHNVSREITTSGAETAAVTASKALKVSNKAVDD